MDNLSKFVKLPVTTWNGHCHIGVNHLFNLSDIKEIQPCDKYRQTRLIFRDGKDELISLYLSEVENIISQHKVYI